MKKSASTFVYSCLSAENNWRSEQKIIFIHKEKTFCESESKKSRDYGELKNIESKFMIRFYFQSNP
jgi:hypothetical protein